MHLHRRDAALPQLGHNRRHFNGKCGEPIFTLGVGGNSASVPKCSEITVVQFSREVSESSLKYSGCCGAAANRRSFSPNVDSRAGGRRGDVSLTSVQVSETFHNEDVARAKSNETLCEAGAPPEAAGRVLASEALHTAAAGRGALQNCRRDCESRARRSE